MLTKIQNELLLKRPLLWNLKVVPAIIATLVFHIIFFIIGFVNGAIDFSEDDSRYYDNTGPVIVVFSILLAVLFVVVWLVFYFRNNAYKSYYPLVKHALFKEWGWILLICILNCSYSASYLSAYDLRARNYFTEEEFARRIDVISMVSIFADGSYRDDGDTLVGEGADQEWIHRETFNYRGRQYPLRSLLNKAPITFSYRNREKDSILERRAKSWLVENRRDSVVWVMDELLKITEGHGLESNVTAEKWASLVYNYPDFSDHITVGRMYRYEENSAHIAPYYDEYGIEEVQVEEAEPRFDSISNTIKVINDITYIFPKNYVPLAVTDHNYSKISRAYSSPDINPASILIYLYFGFGLSLLIFSFRVSSGRSWLIALISGGVTALVTSIISMIFFRYIFYSAVWMLLIAGFIFYFNSRVSRAQSKGNTGIFLNLSVWLSLGLIPLIYNVVDEVLSAVYLYRFEYDYNTERPEILRWLDENWGNMLYLNIVLFLVFMYFYTQRIRQWKGKPEA